MYSYWIVETHCDKIPLAVVGYKNHQSIKKQILTHFPDTINITYIHEESSNEIRIRSHIQNLIQERDQETKQNIIDSINDDIEYYENQIRVMVDSE